MFEAVIYPVLFVTLYFETFVLITFLSRDTRNARVIERASHSLPSVAVIVPCFNEATTIHATIASLKQLTYPADLLRIIVVNDGSIDGTAAALSAYDSDGQVRVIHKTNGGKHTALNAGIAATDTELIGCLDADSFVDPEALAHIVPHFANVRVGAVTASLSLHEPKNFAEKLQHAEYVLGVALRHILSLVNGLYVTPGPFSLYRRSTLKEIGVFKPAHQTEDMEIALRMQQAGWMIGNAPRALVFTKAPQTIPELLRQRIRWTSGFLRNAFDYRALMGNPQHGVLGLMVLPLAVTSVATGASLFVYSVEELVRGLYNAVVTHGDVPIAYLFRVPDIDWFFAPVSAVMLLAVATVVVAATLITLGRRVSGVPGAGRLGIVWFMLLTSFVTPLWLIRSLLDVALGIKRSWR